MLETIKAFLCEKAENPYQRQRELVEKRKQATQAILERTGWPRRGWFLKLLHWAQDTGPMREVENLATALESRATLPDLSERMPARKEQWQSSLKATPPIMLPEKSGWFILFHGSEAEKKDGKVVLKGVGTSGGLVRAPACVVFGPEDFGKLKTGDVLVTVTTTPAWTPLFARASAVVTDIGGPLSHSSIVAREYGIPAVMAARSATRAIHAGQMITVDGGAGAVTLEG